MFIHKNFLKPTSHSTIPWILASHVVSLAGMYLNDSLILPIICKSFILGVVMPICKAYNTRQIKLFKLPNSILCNDKTMHKTSLVNDVKIISPMMSMSDFADYFIMSLDLLCYGFIKLFLDKSQDIEFLPVPYQIGMIGLNVMDLIMISCNLNTPQTTFGSLQISDYPENDGYYNCKIFLPNGDVIC